MTTLKLSKSDVVTLEGHRAGYTKTDEGYELTFNGQPVTQEVLKASLQVVGHNDPEGAVTIILQSIYSA